MITAPTMTTTHDDDQDTSTTAPLAGADEKSFEDDSSKSEGTLRESSQAPSLQRAGASATVASTGKGDQDPIIDEKAENPKMVDIGDGKVFLGTDERTGRAIVKDVTQTQAGPFTTPKWHHSLPFWKMRHPPPPPAASMDDAKIMPDTNANIISQFLYLWITPIMSLGAQRDLTPEDLWKMDEKREAKYLAGKLATLFQKRWDDSEVYNEKLARGDVAVPLAKKIRWRLGGGVGGRKTSYAEKEHEWRAKSGRKEPSLLWAVSDCFGAYFWAAGLFKIVADTLQVTSPLLVKALIRFSTEYHAAEAAGTAPPSIGKGVGMAIGLFLMLMLSSICESRALGGKKVWALLTSVNFLCRHESILSTLGWHRCTRSCGAHLCHLRTFASTHQ